MRYYSTFWYLGGRLTLELWAAKDVALARPMGGWLALLAEQLLACPAVPLVEVSRAPALRTIDEAAAAAAAAELQERSARLAEALATTGGNVSRAAQLVGVSGPRIYQWARKSPEVAELVRTARAAATRARDARLAEALAAGGGSVSRAAAALDLSPHTVWKWKREMLATAAD